jgi:hypothetical protein
MHRIGIELCVLDVHGRYRQLVDPQVPVFPLDALPCRFCNGFVDNNIVPFSLFDRRDQFGTFGIHVQNVPSCRRRPDAGRRDLRRHHRSLGLHRNRLDLERRRRRFKQLTGSSQTIPEGENTVRSLQDVGQDFEKVLEF